MRDRIAARGRRGAVALLALAVVVLAGCASNSAEYDQSTLDPQGPNAEKSLSLLTPFFWIAVVIGVAVVGATVVLALRFRFREGENENPVQTHGNTVLEITWTIVPALILVVMAVFTVATIWDLSEKPAESVQLADGSQFKRVDITVTGKQWWWQYKYHYNDQWGTCDAKAEDGSALTGDAKVDACSFYTANEMTIPAGVPVYLTLRAENAPGTNAGVNHSFWIPNLAGTKDMIPGRTHHLTIEANPDTAGRTFLGQCKEYCGLAHADMRIRVHVKTPQEYLEWVKEQRAPVEPIDQSPIGELMTTYQCASCHALEKTDKDVGIGPNLAHLGSRETFAGAKYELNVENLTKWIWHAPEQKPMQCNHPIGKQSDPNNDQECVGMPNMRDGGMTEAEARQIAEYLINEHK